MIAGLPIVGTFTVATTALAADFDPRPNSPQSLLSIITAANATDAQRLDAAVELVDLNSDDARKLVNQGLEKTSNSAGRIAIAKAIAAASKPDAFYVSALRAMLGPDLKQTRYAAAALVNYRGDSAAFAQLVGFVDAMNNPADSRAEVVHAMGTLIDKEPAQYLVNLVANANQSQSVRDAAAASLAQMTGITAYGNNAAQWQQWLAAQGKTPEQFHAALMEGRAREAAAFRQLQDAFIDLLKNDYYSAPTDARKAELVLKYLDNDSPIVRRAVIDLVGGSLETYPPTAEVKDRLLHMIGDADEKVRLSVVGVLQNSTKLSDAPKLLPKLIARLNIEKSPQVKIEIIRALGKFGLTTGAKAVVGLLNDPDMDVRIAAAKALAGTLGTNYRHDDAAAAADSAKVVTKIIDDNAGHAGTDELRASCIGALVALQGPDARDELLQHIQRDETSVEVRKAALKGIGALALDHADVMVAQQLDSRDPSIRLEAAKALATVARAEDEQRIFHAMHDDLDAAVRQALWQALYKLFDQLTPADLVRYADIFNKPPDKDPDKRLATLLKLGEAYKAKADAEAVARNQQDLAQAMMEVTPPKSADAIKNLREALKYWRDTGKDMPALFNQLVGDLLDDQLNSGQYADATKFAAEQIGINPGFQNIVGPRIKGKADELTKSDPAGAKTLIDEALKMSPTLDNRYVTQLQQLQEEMKRPHP